MTESILDLPTGTSRWRAWFYLVWLSWLRQARARQMVLVALGLLLLSCLLVGFTTAVGGWGMENRRIRVPGGGRAPLVPWLDNTHALVEMATLSPGHTSMSLVAFGSTRAVAMESDFLVFTRGFVFQIFLGFLLPVFSMSFATHALGGERESQTLLWLLTRPLPRSSIYLAKFLALLPWSLGFNLAGFALLCLLAGRGGSEALHLFWPAVLWPTLTFSALFCLMGVWFRRPAIMAIVYSFFLEIIMGNMPGTLKRVSVGFYARCMIYEEASERGIRPENPVIYDPVSGDTAVLVLLTATAALLALGMYVFQRAEYDPGD